MVKICLDTGHYGKYNQSPCNKAYYESEAMWKLTEYLKAELRAYKDCEVVTTRADQKKDLALYSRGQMAKGCDLFISNHSNAATKEDVDYVVVYRGYKNDKSDELGLRLAKAISDIMGVKQTPRTNARKSDKADREYYGVLRGADDAGCPLFYIIENSFHTNPKSTEWLLIDENLKKLAKVQAETIAEYFKLKLIKPSKVPTKAITPESSKEDIIWAQERLNVVVPDWLPKLNVDGDYGPKTRIAVLVLWDILGWAKHMRDDGKKIGTSTREYLARL